MNIKKFNVVKPKKYTTNQGEEKTAWNKVGTLTTFHKEDGSVNRLLEIPAIGLEAQIFEQEDTNQSQTGYSTQPQDSSNGQINPDDIPFD